MSPAETLKAAREALNLTQKELAENLSRKLGYRVTPIKVSRWENERSPLPDGLFSVLNTMMDTNQEEQAPQEEFCGCEDFSLGITNVITSMLFAPTITGVQLALEFSSKETYTKAEVLELVKKVEGVLHNHKGVTVEIN